MDVLDLTRLQFAVVTIYHYFFVPLSISLSAVAAGLHLTWLRTGRDRYRDLTKFVGRLLIVTFAVGVVTACVPFASEEPDVLERILPDLPLRP